jgi:hypothetical protein
VLVRRGECLLGAFVVGELAFGWTGLQALESYIGRQLERANLVYGAFAIVIVLLSWLCLSALVLRCDTGDYDTAATVLEDIDSTTCGYGAITAPWSTCTGASTGGSPTPA